MCGEGGVGGCGWQALRGPLTLTHSHHPSGPAAGPAIPTSNSYSKKTQSNNAENKRPEEDRESGRKASSTAKVPASPLPGLERKKTTPTPSTVSVPPGPPPAGPHSLPCSPPAVGPGLSQQLPLAAYLILPPRPLLLTIESLPPRGRAEFFLFPTPICACWKAEGSQSCEQKKILVFCDTALPFIPHRTASSPPAQIEAGIPHFWRGPALARPPSRMAKTGEQTQALPTMLPQSHLSQQ